MATVEQAINPHTELQQTSTVNSTLNFIPSAATTNNWGAPSYGGIWEAAASSTITCTDHGNDERQAGNPMSRMAFYDHTVGAFIIDTNVNWLGQNNINDLDGGAATSAAHELQYFNQLSPSSEAISSCVLTEENTSDYLTKASELIKRQRELEHDEGPLQKKQRSATGAVSNKELNTKEDTVASNGSSEAGGLALNTNGRPRAKRGSATDPQSVYARQRRERINERLKILQNLVPNGAKVDIVTMLEEAISYVKFLQLQVKLLSSDEYWMYAPTTYNGIDVSFDMLQPSN